MDARKSAELVSGAIKVARYDLEQDGRVRPATWDVIDAALDQLDTALDELERQQQPSLRIRR